MIKLTIALAGLIVLTGCLQTTSTQDYQSSGTQGLLKEGQSIPVIKNRKNLCKRRVVVKKQNYRRITSRDKRRYLYDYVTNIRSAVTSNWRIPSSVQSNDSCTVQIKQRIDGCVKNIKFTQCNHPKMRKSVRDAIAMASPLPMAPHPDIYDDIIEMSFKK